MNQAFTLYGDSRSGNCLKVKWTADYLHIACNWVETDITAGKTRTNAFLMLNAFGQVPTAVFHMDGQDKVLTQSNAIMLFLAEQSGHPNFIPQDPLQRADMYGWLFWEQNSHEPYVAGRRYRRSILGQSPDQIDSEWLPRGIAALERMEMVLETSRFLVGETLTPADIALVAYTRVAKEGDFPLHNYPHIISWITHVEKILDIDPVTEKI